MASYVSNTDSLKTAISHAITFLTGPLLMRCPTPILATLRIALTENLTAHYAPSWVPTDPSRGSGRRCLTFSPENLPPRPVYNALTTTTLQWSEWISALGGMEFDLFVDPGRVYVRQTTSSRSSKPYTIWSEALEKAQAALGQQEEMDRLASRMGNMTVAQQLMQADEDSDDELFVMIADELREPTWMSPIHPRFPNTSLLTVPTLPTTKSRPAFANHSRSSSRSSNSSSGMSFSFSDVSDSASSVSSGSTASSSSTQTSSKLSRRERARQARVFIDASKNEVTNYDGGKTTVLTGGVMLGGRPPKAAPVAPAPAQKTRPVLGPGFNWRAAPARA